MVAHALIDSPRKRIGTLLSPRGIRAFDGTIATP
jgi:hypothetical protein